MLRNFRIFVHKFSTNAQNVLPDEEIHTKLLKVAVIGVPNVGKSTLINNLMDRKVCPTSSKVHTTRVKSRAVFTEGDSQIVFLDTPGLVSVKEFKKFNLEKSCLKDSKSSLLEADIIGVIHDASNIWSRHKLDLKVIRLLEEHRNKPSFLVFNKVDVMKSKRKLLDLTRSVTENQIDGQPIPNSKPIEDKDVRGWPNFKNIFMISALTGDGLEEVRTYLLQKAIPGPWMFPAETWSDQTTRQIIERSVKAKLLDFLPQEIPYTLRPELEFLDVNEKGIISCSINVRCPNQRVARLVAGESDGKLRQISESLQNDLQLTFQNFVRVKVLLQAKPE